MSLRELMRSLSMGCGESLRVSRLLHLPANPVPEQPAWVKSPVQPKQTWGKKKS